MSADFNRCVYFLTVCHWGSVSKAAEKLYISPQALNRQIRLLESELGKPLFSRSTRKLTLTEFGIFFKEQMQPVYNAFISACQEIENYTNNEERSITMGFFHGLLNQQLVLPIVEEIKALRPRLQIELVSNDLEDVYDALRENKQDIALTYVSASDDIADLVAIPILKLQSKVVVSRNHPWASKEHITAEDMASHPVLLISRKNGPDKRGFYAELKASSYHYAKDTIALIAQLCMGQYYAVMPTIDMNELGDSGLVSIPLPEDMDASFTLSFVYSPDNPHAEFFSQLGFLQKKFDGKYPIAQGKI